jgi:hypothetical protein
VFHDRERDWCFHAPDLYPPGPLMALATGQSVNKNMSPVKTL